VSGFRGALHASVAAIALAGGAAPAAARAGLTLPPATLSDSLDALSRAAHVEILADSALLRSKTTPAVRNAPTPEAALSLLLRGSGLRYEQRGGAFLIVRGEPTRPIIPAARADARPPIVAANIDRAQEDPEPESDIVVTGTRIARPELESAMPVSVIHMEDTRNFGRSSAYDALMLNPAIGPGLGIANAQGEVWDAGAAFISLRNMGTNRSLVLVDAMRRVSGSARSSAVDVNMIPDAMIDRIEIVTGGAAAIYGADAVTGAINVIMKKNLTGLHLSATTGLSQQGDARESSFSAATGLKFAGGRGSLTLGGTYTNTAPLRWTDRYTNRISYVANPKNSGPNDGIPDNILDTNIRYMYRSNNPSYYYNGQWYALQGGAFGPVNYNYVNAPGELGNGDGGPGGTGYWNHMLRDQLKTGALIARLNYQLTDAVSWGAHFDYGHSYAAAATVFPEIRDDSRATNWFGGTSGEVATLDNPFLPASLRQFMIANGLTRLYQDRDYHNFPQPLEIHHRNDFTGGSELGGALTGRLKWSAFFQYGQAVDHVDTTNMAKKTEWLQARNVVADPVTGQPECADPAARAAGCVPLNMFSTDAPSQALVDYVLGTRHEWRRNAQSIAGGTINGTVARLPYGDMAIALGAEWRRETLSTRDDPDTAKLADLVYQGVDYTLHPALDAKRQTSELYGELVVPLLKNVRFARRLQIEGAWRFSHYSDNNPDTGTWKAGGSWEPIAGFTLRGVYSHSVRVPNFGELYAPIVNQQLGIVSDPCSTVFITQGPNRTKNCAALGIVTPIVYPYPDGPLVTTGGNQKLMPETSNSVTIGGVFQPAFLPGFDLTVDYWDIRIGNVITQFAYTQIINLCVDSATIDNVFCGLETRNQANGHLQTVSSFNVNAARMIARGIDLGMNYRHRIGPGQFRLDFQGTYLIAQTTRTTPGVASGNVYYAGQWNYPRIKSTLTTRYDLGKFGFAVSTRFISRGTFSNTDASPETRSPYWIPAYVYNDLTVQFRPTDKYSLALGVKNVSNVGVFGPLQDSGSAYYDQIGRYVFAKVDVNF
jgi:outer membrane receptor protein involved in Fe transport